MGEPGRAVPPKGIGSGGSFGRRQVVMMKEGEIFQKNLEYKILTLLSRKAEGS